jgi:Flp pilus assembly protein TadG
MCGLLSRLRRSRRGVAAVEFGLMLPMLMILLVCIVELGRFLAQGEAVEKGLRAGAMYAARQDLPLTGTVIAEIQNMVRTGTTDCVAVDCYLTPGWGEVGAKVDPPVFTQETLPDGTTTVSVIKLTATVPYDELLPGILGFFGLGELSLTMSHEQVHIGA